ncbi:hypothetical protein IX56_17660, partial [Paracoccus sanguinis]
GGGLGPEAARLRALRRAAFEAALTALSAGVRGGLTPAPGLPEWPIISQIADAYPAPRTALTAEAAHV